ncbi:hypothetical protein DPMN_086877 [Dreissena polymorpha]|uniref:Uncharacterized protein n=1 Tax=Dreissena polymorpha TaxID=45954 RepID=A0A9D4QVK8_DREPO|nr:hypothetical protein DPMN_086877 [Dreissena polymorpha]
MYKQSRDWEIPIPEDTSDSVYCWIERERDKQFVYPTSARVRVKPVLTIPARTVLDTSQHSPQLYEKRTLPRLGVICMRGSATTSRCTKMVPLPDAGFSRVLFLTT